MKQLWLQTSFFYSEYIKSAYGPQEPEIGYLEKAYGSNIVTKL